MIIQLLLLSLAASSLAEECWIGDWTEWSDCKPTTSCRAFHDYNPKSWDIEVEAWDEGRMWMEYIVKKKTAHFKEVQRCKAAGTCPEYDARPSSGFEPCQGGTAGGYPCWNIDLMSFTNFQDMGAPGNAAGNDVWGWYDEETGDEYAIMGMTTGTGFVRVTDPSNPVPLAYVPSHLNRASSWRDMKVIGHYAYIVSEATGHGMQVFDLYRLRTRNSLTTMAADVHYPRFGQCHNIVSNPETNYVYGVGSGRNTNNGVLCRGGLHVVDVSDPLNPQLAGCFGTDGYVHDAECVIYRGPDSRYFGQEICFCYNENSLTIVNVENKNNMHVISKRGYTGVAYTHQGWLTEDHATLLLDDEQDEQRQTHGDQNTRTYFWDVNDLTNPILRTIYRGPERSIDHNQYVLGDLTFQANYESGLRVLEINQAAFQLTEVAYFDVFPSRTTANFNGAWSTYPYLPSGNVLISSIDYGLFVVSWPNVQKAEGQQDRYRQVMGCDADRVESRQCVPESRCN